MVATEPKGIVLQFNECIDTANNRIKGKDNNRVQAWEPFSDFCLLGALFYLKSIIFEGP